jgi:hypothetical protein
MANTDSAVLLTRAVDICSSVLNLQIGPSALQDEARELIGLLAQFKPSPSRAPVVAAAAARCACAMVSHFAIRARWRCRSCFDWIEQANFRSAKKRRAAKREETDRYG